MTGDDLITLITEAGSDQAAMDIIGKAPSRAVFEAADLLYIPDTTPMLRLAIVTEARS